MHSCTVNLCSRKGGVNAFLSPGHLSDKQSAERRLARMMESRNSCENRRSWKRLREENKVGKKTVETSAARNVKYKFNLEVHNNHLTIETIQNKQVSASVYLSRDFKRGYL